MFVASLARAVGVADDATFADRDGRRAPDDGRGPLSRGTADRLPRVVALLVRRGRVSCSASSSRTRPRTARPASPDTSRSTGTDARRRSSTSCARSSCATASSRARAQALIDLATSLPPAARVEEVAATLLASPDFLRPLRHAERTRHDDLPTHLPEDRHRELRRADRARRAAARAPGAGGRHRSRARRALPARRRRRALAGRAARRSRSTTPRARRSASRRAPSSISTASSASTRRSRRCCPWYQAGRLAVIHALRQRRPARARTSTRRTSWSSPRRATRRSQVGWLNRFLTAAGTHDAALGGHDRERAGEGARGSRRARSRSRRSRASRCTGSTRPSGAQAIQRDLRRHQQPDPRRDGRQRDRPARSGRDRRTRRTNVAYPGSKLGLRAEGPRGADQGRRRRARRGGESRAAGITTPTRPRNFPIDGGRSRDVASTPSRPISAPTSTAPSCW